MSVISNLLADLRRGKRAQRNAATALYIDLLKKCVSNSVYDDDLDMMRGGFELNAETGRSRNVEPAPADPDAKYYGKMWPSRAHTMIGIPRLDNIQYCVETVLQDGVPGDLIECGVWRGGCTIFMRGILKAHGVADRIVWVADSFAGLPVADPVKYPKESTVEFHRMEELAVPLEVVKSNFERYGLLDDQVRFLQGWFSETLPKAPIARLAVMRLDGDLYESTMDGLVNLYPKLSPGGFVIIDDFDFVPACNEAVDDFRLTSGIDAEILRIAGGGAFWRKPAV